MPDQVPPSPDKRLPGALLTVGAALAVAVLAGGAFILTFDVLREFAMAGRASRTWAPVYPVMVDALMVMAVLSLVVARRAPWWSRWLRGGLLLLLVAGTAAISVQHALWGFGSLPRDPVRAGVAVAPHVMLIVAVWLWLRMIAQLRRSRPPAPAPARPAVSIPPTGTVTVLPSGRLAPPPLALPAENGGSGTEPNGTRPDRGAAVPDGGEPDGDPDTLTTDPEGLDASEDLPIWEWDRDADPPSGSLRSSPTPPSE